MGQTDDRSVTNVLQDIVSNVQEIVRSEVRLAKAEIKEETGKAARAWKPLIAGGVLMLYSGGLLMLAARIWTFAGARTVACRVSGVHLGGADRGGSNSDRTNAAQAG